MSSISAHTTGAAPSLPTKVRKSTRHVHLQTPSFKRRIAALADSFVIVFFLLTSRLKVLLSLLPGLDVVLGPCFGLGFCPNLFIFSFPFSLFFIFIIGGPWHFFTLFFQGLFNLRQGRDESRELIDGERYALLYAEIIGSNNGAPNLIMESLGGGEQRTFFPGRALSSLR